MYPTEKQIKAIKKLEKAFKECSKERVIIHNILGNYHCYDGNKVRNIDDTEENGILVEDSDYYGFMTMISEWADDTHYVHLKE